VKRDPFTASSPELMVHVAKNHKVGRTSSLHAVQSHCQITIAPVDMGLLPITAAGAIRS